jgi:RHS repeat-associated protein
MRAMALSGRPARAMTMAAAALLVASALVVVRGSTAPTASTLSAPRTPSVHGTQVKAVPRPDDLTQGAGSTEPVPVVWPSGSGEVDLTGPAASPARAGKLPVWLRRSTDAAGPSRVRVSARDRAKLPAGWREGVVLDLVPTGGSVAGNASVAVDYAGFATAYGADYATRLRLVQLPACALTSPGTVGCQPVPLPSRNDAALRRVSAEVSVAGGGTTVAVTAGPAGSAGSFGVTSLQASATWTAGGNSGTFAWSYPLRTPPALGGPAPKLSFAYSSAVVDGRSQATNNQPSWIGEGFDWWPGYVERRYQSCSDDRASGANNTADTGDQCWGTDNATMSLNGSGGELVKDDATGTWRLKNDDNSTVERLTTTVNGDNDNEFWKITTADGTQYFFGLNRLPGFTGTAPADRTTNSTWTVPVAGNHAGEPCHAATFGASFCNQAWRWNLDYVVDPNGNTMSMYYGTETNRYARNNIDTDAASYVRGGWLDHIEYGTDNRSGTDTAYTATSAPMRIDFASTDRCLADCGTHDAAHWPDTPWDQECGGSSCAGDYSPTFWTTRRLSTVTTKVWNAATSRYREVDSWTLKHTFPDPGDGTRAGMWLESITQTGKADGPTIVGSAITLPEVNFDWVQLPNRVDTTTDGKFPMNWMRLSTIWTETGGKIDVRYSGPDCVPGSRMPASPQSNTLRCYPVLEEQPNQTLKAEYFHKYVVTSVTEADRTGGGPDVVTSYEYVGTPTWRHTDDDGLTKDKLRTWSDYRGYAQVKTRVGDPGSGTRTLAESIYFRGMHGDLNGSGGTRTVLLPAIDGNGDGDTSDPADAPAVPDEDNYSGMVRKSTIFNGVESAPVSATFSEPWQSAPTASRNMGQNTVYARHIATKTTWAATALASGGWRVSRVDNTFDAYGMPTASDDQGDVAAAGDEQCVRTTYNRNPGANLLATVGRVETYALRCATPPTSSADIIADTRTSYDGQAYGVAPTRGQASRVEVAKGWSPSGGSVWLTRSTTAFDPYGRPVDLTDVRGNHTTVAYTPATGGPVTAFTTTTPLGTSTTTVEPAWGTPIATVDANGKRTEATLDALGRTRQVWQANHTKADFPSAPSATYTYLIRNSGGVNAVTSAELNAATTTDNAVYTTTYALFDGLLRPRQTQSPAMATGNVGTVLTETRYDDKGRPASRSQHYDNAVQPSTTLFTSADWQPSTQTTTSYDRAGRTVASVFRSAGAERWRTTTSYGGDRVSVTPPPGGTATTALTDARGRTVELRQYRNPADIGSNVRSRYDAVTFHFDRTGQQDSVTDNAGNTWTYTFDLLGRRTGSRDPDKGSLSASYNDAGDVLTTMDGRGQSLAFTYDQLGRRTGEYAGSVAPASKLATWTYDPLGFKGMLASSSRWTNGGTTEFKVKVRSYTPLYQSTGEDYTIPGTLTGLAGTYPVSRTFRVDGSPDSLTYPAAGGLAAETVTTTYDPATGLPEKLLTNSGQSQYVANTDYNAFGELAFVQYQLQAGSWLQRSFSYDDATHRLARATTIRQTTPQAVDDTSYDYDAVGNITRIAATPASGPVDTQCFGYDHARRLTDAWTPASGDCGQSRSAAGLGGPAPYWQSWTFDPVGNRTGQTSHAVAGDSTTSYTYPAAGSPQPHTAITATTGTTVLSYGYDAAGNTTCRPAATAANVCPASAASQTLDWDQEGHLATATDTVGTSRYTYTADGERLLADDPTTTTLYLPGTEIKRVKATGVVTANRYFAWAGQICAMKTTGGAVTWLIGDHQGTQSISVAAGTQAISVRRQTPYGVPRGAAPTWPNTKGFVGGDLDRTGLTHLGAREYDPGLGRFVSGDPVFDESDPQSWSGYAYAGNSPVTSSDPSGLMRTTEESGGGGGSSGSGCNYGGYAQYYCEQAKKAGEVRRPSAGDTTRQREMDACYQLARARQGCNYNTPPTAQLAQYQQKIDAENQQRAAEVAAAIEAERRAEAERNIDCTWNPFSNRSCIKKFAAQNPWVKEVLDAVALVTMVAAMAFPVLGPVALFFNIASAVYAAATGDVVGALSALPGVRIAEKAWKVGRATEKAAAKYRNAFITGPPEVPSRERRRLGRALGKLQPGDAEWRLADFLWGLGEVTVKTNEKSINASMSLMTG